MAYQFESRIRFSEVGQDRRLTKVSLVDYFQDCSTFHSEECGIGIDCLDAHGCVWMILFWQIDILRLPQMGEHVITRTWPYDFQAFYGYRNFALLDDREQYLAKANSVWALIDRKTERPMRVLPEVANGYGLEPRLDMEYLPRKMKLSGEGEQMEAFRVGRSIWIPTIMSITGSIFIWQRNICRRGLRPGGSVWSIGSRPDCTI